VTFLSFLLDSVSLKHIYDNLPLEKIPAFTWANVECFWTGMQQINSFFLFAATYFLKFKQFYSLLKQYLFSLPFCSCTANRTEQTRFAKIHLLREYGHVSQHLFPAVFLSLAFNFNNYLLVPLFFFPHLRYLGILCCYCGCQFCSA